MMMDVNALSEFAEAHNLWVVEDAAHAFPAAWRGRESDPWLKCGQMEDGERRVVCFSFYANKTITTGEGGMAVTGSAELAKRMRLMSLHGLSEDAWKRYSGANSWDYRIVAPGLKYNLTDIAAAIGIHQLSRAEEMRRQRNRIARFYLEALGDLAEIELPLKTRTAFTRGTCFLSGCSWTNSQSTAISLSINSKRPELVARFTGGRCTCIPTTRKRLGVVRKTSRSPQHYGNA